MWRETRIGPQLPPGPNQEQRTVPVMHLRRRTLPCSLRRPHTTRGAFTLIELLTVITIIAILATLLLTTLSSVKRKAREAVCTSNLHQIGIALGLYLEDFGKRPPSLATLAAAKYLGDGKILVCPADRSAGSLMELAEFKSRSVSEMDNASPALRVSYQHPLAWSDEEWSRLMQAQTRAGVVACTFHDIASRDRGGGWPGAPAEGLILRGQLDGTVVRRQIYRSAVSNDNALPPGDGRAGVPAAAFGAPDAFVSPSLPAWEFFSDDPPP